MRSRGTHDWWSPAERESEKEQPSPEEPPEEEEPPRLMAVTDREFIRRLAARPSWKRHRKRLIRIAEKLV